MTVLQPVPAAAEALRESIAEREQAATAEAAEAKRESRRQCLKLWMTVQKAAKGLMSRILLRRGDLMVIMMVSKPVSAAAEALRESGGGPGCPASPGPAAPAAAVRRSAS